MSCIVVMDNARDIPVVRKKPEAATMVAAGC